MRSGNLGGAGSVELESPEMRRVGSVEILKVGKFGNKMVRMCRNREVKAAKRRLISIEVC